MTDSRQNIGWRSYWLTWLLVALLLTCVSQFLGADLVCAGGAYLPVWTVHLSGQVTCLDMSANGTVIIVGHGKTFSLLDSTGKTQWDQETASETVDVDLSSDGMFAYAADAGNVYLMGKDRGLINTAEGISASSVTVNSSLFLGLTRGNWLGWNDEFLFLPPNDASGTWKTGPLGQNHTSAIAVADENTVFVTGGSATYKELSDSQRLGVQCYDFAGNLQWQYKDIDATASSSDAMYSVAISDDAGTVVASNAKNSSVYVLSRNGALISRTSLGDIRDVAASPDGRYVGAVSSTGATVLTRDGESVWSYQSNPSVACIALSRNADLVLVGAEDGSLTLFKNGRTVAQSAISNAEQAIAKHKSGGILVTEASDLLVRAQDAFAQGDYSEAQSLSTQAGQSAEDTAAAAVAAQASILDAKKAVTQQKSASVVTGDASTLLDQAQSSFKHGDYNESKRLADRAKQVSESAGTAAAAAKDTMQRADQAIRQETAQSYSVSKAAAILRGSQDAFGRGDYAEAGSLAADATRTAQDIDGDGVPNERDFAPYISNRIVYAAIAALLAVLLATVSIVVGASRRRRRAGARNAEILAGIAKCASMGFDMGSTYEAVKRTPGLEARESVLRDAEQNIKQLQRLADELADLEKELKTLKMDGLLDTARLIRGDMRNPARVAVVREGVADLRVRVSNFKSVRLQNLVDEAASLIGEASANARARRDSLWLQALIVLQTKLEALLMRMGTPRSFVGRTDFAGYMDVLNEMTSLHGDADVLSRSPGSGSGAEGSDAGEKEKADFYAVLGISVKATADEIERAYRREIQKCHPDGFYQNSQYVQIQMDHLTALLNEAYQTLKDSGLRREYDRQRQAP